ncbi:MAG: NTP transferase domain-containing protein [Deltaproteobacteria bacterium]|nr:NTP transferase domain-containing protein [Deltaproteobacteria bacterium]
MDVRLADIPLLILAGGRATRLGTLSEDLPKFLMPIGEQKRFADVQLAWAHAQGFRRIVLSVGYRGELIEQYCQNGDRWQLSISYAKDGDRPLGTAGAVKRAFADPPPCACVLYGDTILELDCVAAVRRLETPGAVAVMTVLADPPAGHRPNADFDGTRVLYAKKTPDPSWRYIDYGFLVLSDRFLREVSADVPLDLAEPLEIAARAGRLAGMAATVPFCEINTPEALNAFRDRFTPWLK